MSPRPTNNEWPHYQPGDNMDYQIARTLDALNCFCDIFMAEERNVCPMKVCHRITHFLCFFSSSGLRGLGMPPAICCVVRSARTRLVKTSSTLCAVFAEVSINEQPNDRASAIPSSFVTSRSYDLSHLFPTRMNTGFCLFTRSIDCRKTSSLSKVDRDAIEYTRINPCPSL
jgi:hypothetical protein